MKRTIFKVERDQTKAGRTINALLAFLTANRYALIFTFRLTLVKRAYQPKPFKKRLKENILVFLILFPLALSLLMMLQKCIQPTKAAMIQTDSLEHDESIPSKNIK